MNRLSLHVLKTTPPVSHLSTPYDNAHINSRHLNNGKFDLFHTAEPTPPSRPPVRSVTTSGIRPNDIWGSFFQRTEGNCVTTSAIKAAMTLLGSHPAGIFDKISATTTGFDIVMRDAVEVSLTHDELRQAQEKAGFGGYGKTKRHAIFLYAAVAKRAQNEKNDGMVDPSYKDGLNSLNNGESPGESLTRLGLKGLMRKGTVEELKNGAIGTLADFSHSVVAVDGHLDFWGRKRPLTGSGWEHGTNALILDPLLIQSHTPPSKGTVTDGLPVSSQHPTGKSFLRQRMVSPFKN